MNQQSRALFERLNVITYPIYHNDGRFEVWKSQEKSEHLYTIKEVGEKFDIFDPDQIMLADSMTVNKVMDFIHNDLCIGSPLEGAVVVTMGKPNVVRNEQGFVTALEDNEEEEVEFDKSSSAFKMQEIIEKAAKRQGVEAAGTSLLRELAARKEINKRTSGTVKKKRKIDLDDLDLEDDI